MTFTKRVVVTTLLAWAFLLWGGPVAAADTIVASGSDTTRSMLYAGIAGLAVGGVIAFVQSRKRRRNDDGERDD